MPSPYLLVEGLVSGPAWTVPSWPSSVSLVISAPSRKGRDIATWAYSSSYLVPTNGTISGTVSEVGTPIPNCVVCIYYRPNGLLIARTKADAAGNFTFTGLDPTLVAGQYFVVALDPDGGVLYNALIFDRILAT
jgi:hypothetical protein